MFADHLARQQKEAVEGRGVDMRGLLVSPVISDIVMFFVLLLVSGTVLQRFALNVAIIITIGRNGFAHDREAYHT